MKFFEKLKIKQQKRTLSFSVKIAFMIAIPFLLITAGMAFLIYLQSRDIILEQMSNRLKNIGRAGSLLFTPQVIDDIKFLNQEFYKASRFVEANINILNGEDGEAYTNDDETFYAVEEQQANEIMNTPEFKRVVQVLRAVRLGTRENLYSTEEELQSLDVIRKSSSDLPTINYVYLMAKVPKENGSQKFFPTKQIMAYLVDADYLAVEDDGTGEPYEGNPIGNVFYPVTNEMASSFSSNSAIAEREFPEPDEWGDIQLSGYTPILDDERNVVSAMGIDYNVQGEANRLILLRNICFATGFSSLVIALLLTLFIRNWVQHPLNTLIRGADEVRNKNFDTQIKINSRDEMGDLALAFNTMIGEIKTFSRYLQKLNTAFVRFVPKEFLAELEKSEITDIAVGDQVEREMAVMFAKLDFEKDELHAVTSPQQLIFLNSFLEKATPIIRKHNGFIDKFMGFTLMAIFPKSSYHALSSAIEILNQVKTMNTERKSQKLPLVKATCGIHFGKLILGTVGHEDRMDSTVISDAVNLASRFEGIADQLNASIICSEQVVEKIKVENVEDKNKLHIYSRLLGKLAIKGKKQRIKVYEIYNNDPPDVINKKEADTQKFEKGIHALQVQKNLILAQELLQEVYKNNPADKVVQVHLNKIRKKLNT